MADDDSKVTFVQLINLCGSIASLTGISLLWARGSVTASQLPTAIPVIAIAVSLFLGCCAILWYAGLKLWEFVEEFHHGLRAAYVCFALAGAFYCMTMAGRTLYTYAQKEIGEHPSLEQNAPTTNTPTQP